MAEPEITYLLTGEELLLLFSLADRRPVVAFALPDPAQVPAGRWTQVAVDLYQKGMADYTGVGVVPAAPVAELLTAMKDAGTVCLVLSRDAACKTQALYQDGGRCVLLQGNYWPGYRLQVWNDTPARWLDNCLGLPKRIPLRGPDLPESQLAPDLDIRSGPALTDPPSDWSRWEQARVILDVYRDGRPEQRLVWWQGAAGCAVLCQSQSGTRLLPDCQPTRDALKQRLWKGDLP